MTATAGRRVLPAAHRRALWLALLLAMPSVLLPAPPPAPNIASMRDGEAQRMAARISKDVESLRGLKFKAAVPVKVTDDAATRAHMTSRLHKFWPEKQVKTDEKAWEQLGLLPPGTDLMASLLNVIEEQAGGYYDPPSDTFFVLDDMPRAIAPILMAHELTHALDDQHFGIDRLIEKAKDDNDRSTAIAAVVEGSGTVIMSTYLVREIKAGRMALDALQTLQETEAGRGERLMAAPGVLLRGLLAPYILGQTFLLRGKVGSLATGVNMKDINHAFEEPPRSTEQILHPEKYWDETKRDEPRAVPLPDLSAILGEGWSLAAKGNLGELNVATLAGATTPDIHAAEIALPSRWTNGAASGWGGDLWHHYVSEGKSATVLATLWDTPGDAAEFSAALEPDPRRTVAQRGDALVIVAGEAGDRAVALAQAALDAVAIRGTAAPASDRQETHGQGGMAASRTGSP
jgi:hypothetical protein